jgi:two-component system sensor histidine kinase/response regulator
MADTILIADDEEFIVDLLATLLEDEGYRVLRAYDGLEALTLAERERPDLVLSDVMMPRLSGIELARRLRISEDGSGPPIVLLSAVDPPRDLPERTIFAPKPFDLEHLATLVARLLGRT